MINNYGIDNDLFEIDIVIAAGFVLMCSIRLINPSRVERVRVDVFMLFKVYIFCAKEKSDPKTKFF